MKYIPKSPSSDPWPTSCLLGANHRWGYLTWQSLSLEGLRSPVSRPSGGTFQTSMFYDNMHEQHLGESGHGNISTLAPPAVQFGIQLLSCRLGVTRSREFFFLYWCVSTLSFLWPFSSWRVHLLESVDSSGEHVMPNQAFYWLCASSPAAPVD